LSIFDCPSVFTNVYYVIQIPPETALGIHIFSCIPSLFASDWAMALKISTIRYTYLSSGYNINRDGEIINYHSIYVVSRHCLYQTAQ